MKGALILAMLITTAMVAQYEPAPTEATPCIVSPRLPGGSLRFWRIHMDSAQGDWHLFNAEDKKFLDETQARIKSGQYKNTRIEWVAIEGYLPK